MTASFVFGNLTLFISLCIWLAMWLPWPWQRSNTGWHMLNALLRSQIYVISPIEIELVGELINIHRLDVKCYLQTLLRYHRSGLSDNWIVLIAIWKAIAFLLFLCAMFLMHFISTYYIRLFLFFWRICAFLLTVPKRAILLLSRSLQLFWLLIRN